MDLCAGCGSLTLPSPGPCSRCGSERRVSAPSPWPSWVSVRCTFLCRSCGHRTPVDHLETDGSVTCRSCGIDQAFRVETWKEMLPRLHGLADLTGGPEGRTAHPRLSIAAINPHRDIGSKRASVDWKEELEGEDGFKQVLRVEASPGHPVCPLGHGPMKVTRGKEILARCGECGTEHRYQVQRLPAYPALVATLTEEARIDQKIARTRDGIDGFSCPGCGAPLPVENNQTLSTCSFCHLTSRLPRQKGKSANPAPAALWWILFEGDSPLREKLVRSPGESARAIEEAPPRTGADPIGAGLRWGPWLVLPTVALVVSGLIFFLLVQRGLITPWTPE